jgi:hypothetical protein
VQTLLSAKIMFVDVILRQIEMLLMGSKKIQKTIEKLKNCKKSRKNPLKTRTKADKFRYIASRFR